MDKTALCKRLNQTFDFLKDRGVFHTVSEAADKSEIRQPHLSSALNGDEDRLTKGLASRFAKAYSEYINGDWLLTGEGQMAVVDKKKTRIHIPADKAVVSAGFEGRAIGSVPEDECELRPVMTPFAWYDFTITVEGDSMEPELRNGDIIACEWLSNSIELRPDKIYVVDSAEGAVVKQLNNSGKELVCHSINPLYQDFTIRPENVLRIARVIGLIREL